jgi:hypothetical protein
LKSTTIAQAVSALIKRVIYLRDINVEGDADSDVVYRPTKSVESDHDLEGQIKHILINIASSYAPPCTTAAAAANNGLTHHIWSCRRATGTCVNTTDSTSEISTCKIRGDKKSKQLISAV